MKYILIFIILLTFVHAATLEVGSTKPYKSIQSAVDAANSGDTILVYDGVYKESVTITKSGLTLQSRNEWGAVMDGQDFAFYGSVIDNTKITGFRFQNYNTDELYKTRGTVYIKGRGTEIKYNYFTGCHASTGFVNLHANGGAVIIRGNIFTGNTVFPTSTGDHPDLDIIYSKNSIIELNRFADRHSGQGGLYNIYVHGGNNEGNIVRYNYIANHNRLREGRTYDVNNNIFGNYVQFHEESPQSYSDHNMKFYRNTVTSTGYGAYLVRVDNTQIYDNLFIGTNIAMFNNWGTPAGTVFSGNHVYNVANIAGGTEFSYTEQGTTTGDPKYNSQTGWHNRLSHNQGADLKIDVWPFTKQDGTALATDYPYSSCTTGQARSCSTGNPGICSAGTQTCSNGVWGACVQTQQPKTEICGNGIDEDCSGSDLACSSVCGDQVCQVDEDCSSCPDDCGICDPVCGDGSCNGDESCASCEQDCGVCPEPVGSVYWSADVPIELMGTVPEETTANVYLPAVPSSATLHLLLFDWDSDGEGQIFLNGHVINAPFDRINCNWADCWRNMTIDASWLVAGSNEVKFTHDSTAGFNVYAAGIGTGCLTLSDVISAINTWKSGQKMLLEVMNAIVAWKGC